MNITFPKLKFPFERDSFDALQKMIDQLRDMFTGRISYRDNMQSDVITLDFVAGSTPSKRVVLPGRPLGVVLMDLRQIEPASNTPPVVADSFSWTYADGALTFPAFGGIAGSSKFRATILIVRG